MASSHGQRAANADSRTQVASRAQSQHTAQRPGEHGGEAGWVDHGPRIATPVRYPDNLPRVDQVGAHRLARPQRIDERPAG